ncbi:MAG: DUF488 domain-containing protein [Candidatus Hodarchaeaceae archaeon]|nr:DUF488 domain-containing protein [Candidatus Hodarchaeaceae archaeon]
MGVATARIYTIGYGNRKFDDFLALLERFGIELVVDVRSFPTSKWPEFVKENLQETLPARGIDYVHLRELGGYRRGGYEAHMHTADFKHGLEKLTQLARERVATIMCVESSPSACHRRFIARRLRRRGWEVVHIVGKGKQQTL